MIIERLATKVAIEAKAAMSRIRSVIIVSLGSLCFYFVLFRFTSQQKNRTVTYILDILALLVNERLMVVAQTDSSLGDPRHFVLSSSDWLEDRTGR
ncbi:hypothetical protein CYG48_04555 [Neorhizobium sp. SOG26]|nr:hypothetical protein CYG48_04555 [Neorhizobium sp. SOG26]